MVPNYSFEVYDTCPFSAGQIYYATPWFDATQSVDYYNACSIPGGMGVPTNFAGNQNAFDGSAYAGFIAFAGSPGSNLREYIEVKLLAPLYFNTCYKVAFYVSICDNVRFGVNALGAYFSNTAISGCYQCFLPYTPQFNYNSSSVIGSSSGWFKIEGTFIASGGEQYMTIANFNTDANTITTPVNLSPDPSAYYYIDSVSVLEIKNVNAGSDKIICNGDSAQIGSNNYMEIIYSWQPATGLSNANIGNPLASPVQTTTYYLTQTTPCGVTKDSVTITICDTTQPKSGRITVPNIFTPNNDAINDVFKITSKNITRLNCKIYNRWGILVSELTKINEAWDGLTTSGLQCENGVYYYVVTATGEDGKEYNEKGVVSLVR